MRKVIDQCRINDVATLVQTLCEALTECVTDEGRRGAVVMTVEVTPHLSVY